VRGGAVVVASLLTVVAAVPALAGGVVGDPQPELAQFSVPNPSDGGGGGTVMPDGTIVLAWPLTDTSLRVCTLDPGSRKCVTLVSLANDAGQSLYGPPAVVATGGQHVSVLVADEHDTISYNSTNDGHSFTGPIEVGSMDVPVTSAVAGGQVVTGGYVPAQGFTVQTIDPTGPLNSTAAVLPAVGCDYAPSVSSYDNGVLAACNNLTNTYVYYAHAGSDFNEASSYTLVDTIRNQQVVTLSGRAILTVPSDSLTTGGIISFFGGSSFGSDHRVPDSAAGDDGYWTMQLTGATAHVFFLGRRDSYDVIQETTTTGATWSHQVLYGSAIDSDLLVPVLGPTGAGQVFETEGTPQLCQPILNQQSVRIALARTRVKAGVRGVVIGHVGPHLLNELVTLEKLRAGKWYPAYSTRETASGTFRFTVPGVSASYRAVVNYKPGYYEYGYSNAVTLTVVR
jgi:hypothetical protein